MLKAIETEYKGYRFRSRLEARWAVFFDACGVKWEYEPEGFDLGDGVYYLPDFLLHDVFIMHCCDRYDPPCYIGDLWVEVKGVMTENDANKIEKFAAVSCDDKGFTVQNPILILANIPAGDSIDDLDNDMWNAIEECQTIVKPFNFELIDFDWYPAFHCVDKKGNFTLVGDDSNYKFCRDDAKTAKAFKLARQARFEHSEGRCFK